MGLIAKPLRGRIFFDVPNTKLLSEKIAPFVPPAMRYKLHPVIEAEIPFDASRFTIGPPKVLFDEAVAEDVTFMSRTDVSFFCIDVAGTHNFVTTGGVVHNCRPPGNRDPQPDEIESCQPWLAEQIALIDPKVICSLGNFSTRLLLGKPAGISRVRGQRFKYQGRCLIPTFHPAAILHGGRTSAAMGQMEDDFRLIAKTLEEVSVQPEADPDAEQLGLF
jgi:uracil DNA glycosylase superfamily protein